MITAYKKFMRKASILRGRAEHVYARVSHISHWEFRYLSTGILLDNWQTWCEFCRDVIILSCNGTVTRSGTNVVPRENDNTWHRIAYEANQARNGQRALPGKIVNYRRHEPTWGDQNFLLTVIPALSPNNAPNLLTGFGLSAYGPKHIQIVRNATAHLNSESMSEVRKLLPYYNGGRLSHPTELMWWTEPRNNSDAIFVWIEELELIASQVTL